ncbi:MAG: dihydrodipicolinate synthase family protein [Microvirga sp.]
MTTTGADLRGLVAAVVLPFQPDGIIDWHGYRCVLDHCASADEIRAVFVNGHAGEGASLSRAERVEVIRQTRRHVGSRKPLLSGLIAFSTAEALEEARAAEDAGADVAVLFPPPAFAAGGASTVEAPLALLDAILERVSIPLSVFQLPVRSGFGYSTEALVAMAKRDRCIAVKEGSDDITLYEANFRALREAAPNLAVLASNFEWFLAQLAIGSDGILSGLLSLVPRHLGALWQAAECGNLDAMRASSDRLYPIVRAIYAPPRMDMHTRIKAGLKHLKVIACDHPRGPLQPLTSATSRDVAEALTRCGVTEQTA